MPRQRIARSWILSSAFSLGAVALIPAQELDLSSLAALEQEVATAGEAASQPFTEPRELSLT